MTFLDADIINMELDPENCIGSGSYQPGIIVSKEIVIAPIVIFHATCGMD